LHCPQRDGTAPDLVDRSRYLSLGSPRR
jgi:hypothetical protein